MKKLNRYQKLSLVWLVAGLALFAFLVYRTGLRTIASNIKVFGGYFLLLLLISGMRQVLRTFTWRYCIEREHRQVSLWELFKLRLVGDAITDLTFAGPVLGETAKTYAAAEHMPLTFSLSSIFIENLLYSLAVIVFIISGAFVLLGRIALPQQIRESRPAGVDPPYPADMPERVAPLWPFVLELRLRFAIAVLLLPISADRVAAVVPHHSGRAEADRPPPILQSPTQIDIVPRLFDGLG